MTDIVENMEQKDESQESNSATEIEVVSHVQDQERDNDVALESDENNSDEPAEEVSTESPEDGEIEDVQDALETDSDTKIGDAFSAMRKSLKEKYEGEIGQLRQEIESFKRSNAYVPTESFDTEGAYQQHMQQQTILDPITGQYVDVNSPHGQFVMQEKVREEREIFAKQQKVQIEQQQKIEKFKEKLDEGNLVYKNFQTSRDAVKSVASDQMAMALLESDKGNAIINYLGKNPKELEKFQSMDPFHQMKEVFKLEERLRPSRKLSSKASQPVKPVNTSLNKGAAIEDQSFESRAEYYRQRLYGGR